MIAPVRSVTLQTHAPSEATVDLDPYLRHGEPLPDLDPLTSDEEEPGIKRCMSKPGGRGPCLKARWGGKMRELHDGAGLCSPGRWLPKDRLVPNWKGLEVLRNKWINLLHTHVPDVQRAVMKLAFAQATESPFPPCNDTGSESNLARRA